MRAGRMKNADVPITVRHRIKKLEQIALDVIPWLFRWQQIHGGSAVTTGIERITNGARILTANKHVQGAHPLPIRAFRGTRRFGIFDRGSAGGRMAEGGIQCGQTIFSLRWRCYPS